MAKNTARSEMTDPKVGYSDNMFLLQHELLMYTRFMNVFIKLKLMSVRNAQILCSNHSQRRFEQIRNGEF